MKARDDGVTALLIAARKGYENLLRALIEAGADGNTSRDTGVTPLVVAAQKGHGACGQTVKDAGAV